MVHVTSEIGRLRKALVHEPGLEVDRMVPAMMEQLLFDDILYGERARDEHARFRRVMQLFGIEVLEASDLLTESLENPEARAWVVHVVFDELSAEDKQTLLDKSPAELTALFVSGSRTRPHPRGLEARDLFTIPPLPNWCFQRDPQVVLGDGVIFSSMAAPARHREALLSRLSFRFHPQLRDVPVLFDPLQTRGEFVELERPHLEGGDLLVLSPEVLAIGLSERTNLTAVRHLTRALARREGGPRWMFVVEVPRRRAYMHLDTVMTVVDRGACLVYEPVIVDGGREQSQIYRVDLHAPDPCPTACGPLLNELAASGLDLEPIPCGGDDPVAQQREQWTDGANALALAPGVIALFDRNVATAAELTRRGFEVVVADDLLLGRTEIDIDAGRRICVLIPSHEISRARGGPHCLVHPLVRDDLD